MLQLIGSSKVCPASPVCVCQQGSSKHGDAGRSDSPAGTCSGWGVLLKFPYLSVNTYGFPQEKNIDMSTLLWFILCPVSISRHPSWSFMILHTALAWFLRSFAETVLQPEWSTVIGDVLPNNLHVAVLTLMLLQWHVVGNRASFGRS